MPFLIVSEVHVHVRMQVRCAQKNNPTLGDSEMLLVQTARVKVVAKTIAINSVAVLESVSLH